MSQESAVEPLVAAINMKRVAASSVTNISICMDSYFRMNLVVATSLKQTECYIHSHVRDL